MTAIPASTSINPISFRGRRWDVPPISVKHETDELIREILLRRDVADIDSFLTPNIMRDLPKSGQIPGLDEAVARLSMAVRNGETIGILGDYDVDGATSAAQMIRWCRQTGLKSELYIPDRINEGYGANAGAIRHLAEKQVSLIVCVDNGTTAFAALEEAENLHIDVLVLDHHVPQTQNGIDVLPPAVAIVNPNCEGGRGGYGMLCAAGVVWVTLVMTTTSLKRNGFFDEFHPAPTMSKLLDLVALGTIADVVPLTGLNRSFVSTGLRVQDKLWNAGMASMSELSGTLPTFEAWHSGFIFGPRINAAGRIGDCSLGAQMLATDDQDRAGQIAAQIEALNTERKAMCDLASDESLALIPDPPPSAIVIASKEWHPGIIGIVAGRLKERYARPTFVFAIDAEKGVAKGSGRSVPGFDLGKAVHDAAALNILTGGGHAMAAGATINIDRLADFQNFLNERCKGLPEPCTDVDLQIDPEHITIGFIQALQTKMGPFGQGNREPLLLLPSVRVIRISERRGGTVHVQGENGRTRIEAILFRGIGTPLGDSLLNSTGAKIDILARAGINEYKGRVSVDFKIEDARRSFNSNVIVNPISPFRQD